MADLEKRGVLVGGIKRALVIASLFLNISLIYYTFQADLDLYARDGDYPFYGFAEIVNTGETIENNDIGV